MLRAASPPTPPFPFRSVVKPITSCCRQWCRFDLAQGNFRTAFDVAKGKLQVITNADGDAWVLEDPRNNERAVGVPMLLPEDM